MRLFVGVEVDPIVKRYIYEIAQNIRYRSGNIRASWVNEDNYHITLQFIGEVPDESISFIDDKLSQIKFKPFSLTLDSLGVFGYPPKVLWIGIKPNHQLDTLASSVNDLLKGDIKRFHPHITLARIKSRVNSSFFDVVENFAVRPIDWEVNRFVLFQSKLTPRGSIYTPIKIYPSI